MDKYLIGKAFRLDSYTTYPCPSCGKDSLKHDKNKFHFQQTASSLKNQYNDYWDPEWIEEIFTSILICEDPKCKEVVACSGVGGVDWEILINERGDQEQDFFSYYIPKTFTPTLKYINIPKECPDSVKDNLNEAFSLTLLSPSSAANKVRAAVENLLTEFKIPRYKNRRKNGVTKGRRVFISLHERIVLAEGKKTIFKELSNILIAIKWLGNEGSHATSGITESDIFDAYRLIEHILNEIYSPQSKLQKRAEEITKNKGVKKVNK
ncbi:DUF4145 domain-containing protein [Yersinia enterocolitica]|nr:DUF4145 domain-containing protein [Yersinia enterocolitica]EKN5099324.1 DUF4145 domain-containing protein [Yersinia enterocolitica]